MCEELGVEEQVFPLAVNYLDRFLCNCCISKRHLQLAASVCIMLASKIRQCQYVSIETLCFYADHSITSQEMKVRKKSILLYFFFFLLLNLFAPAPERKMRHWKVTEFFFLEEDEIVIHSPQEEVEVDRS